MPDFHPNRKDQVVGTGEIVWLTPDNELTLDKTQRVYRNAVGELVSAGSPGAKPVPAGWRYIYPQDSALYLAQDKQRDEKPVFNGQREYPIDFPKVAATIRHNAGLGVLNPDQQGTLLLTSIVHHLEKISRNFGKENKTTEEKNGVVFSTFTSNTPHGPRVGLRIKKGNKEYKIVVRSSFCRPNNRHAWSIYIDTKPEKGEPNFYERRNDFEGNSDSGGHNFKLAPEGKTSFTAGIVKDKVDHDKEEPLNDEERTLLEEINQLLQ